MLRNIKCERVIATTATYPFSPGNRVDSYPQVRIAIDTSG